jgi:hypothetical protein
MLLMLVSLRLLWTTSTQSLQRTTSTRRIRTFLLPRKCMCITEVRVRQVWTWTVVQQKRGTCRRLGLGLRLPYAQGHNQQLKRHEKPRIRARAAPGSTPTTTFHRYRCIDRIHIQLKLSSVPVFGWCFENILSSLYSGILSIRRCTLISLRYVTLLLVSIQL